MTPERYRKLRSLARQLEKLAAKADALDLAFKDGAQIGNMLGVIAAEINTQCDEVQK